MIGATSALIGVAIGTALARWQARRADLALLRTLATRVANTEPPTIAELEVSA